MAIVVVERRRLRRLMEAERNGGMIMDDDAIDVVDCNLQCVSLFSPLIFTGCFLRRRLDKV